MQAVAGKPAKLAGKKGQQGTPRFTSYFLQEAWSEFRDRAGAAARHVEELQAIKARAAVHQKGARLLCLASGLTGARSRVLQVPG